MKTAHKTSMLSIKIDPKVKSAAQKVADELGFSLSSIINASLKDLARTKTISYSIPEIPNKALAKAIQEARSDRKTGKNSFGPFTPEESVAFLRSL